MRAAPRVFGYLGAATAAAYPFLTSTARLAAFTIVGLAGALAVLSGIRHRGPGGRAPWVLSWVALATLVAAHAIDRAHLVALDHTATVPSAFDGAVIAGYVFTAIAGAIMARSGMRSDQSDTSIEVSIATIGVGVLFWAFVLLPLSHAAGASGGRVLVLAVFVVFDLTMLVATVQISRRDRNQDVGVQLFVLGMGALLGADAAFAVVMGDPTGALATTLDVLWLLGYVALGMSGLCTPSTAAREQGHDVPMQPFRRLLLGAALLVSPVALTISEVREGDWDQVVVGAGALALAVLVVLRMKRDRERADRAEEALRLSERRLRSLVEHASDLIVVIDGHGTLSYVSPSSEGPFSGESGRVVGRPMLDLVHPDDASFVQGTFDRALREANRTGAIELRVRDGKGVWRWVDVRYSNRLDDPSVGGIVLNVRDLTDRHAVETALREREAQYHSFFEGNQAVMLLIDTESGSIVDANASAAEYYGYSRERLALMRVEDLRADDHDAVIEEMRRASEERRSYFALRHRLASGAIRHVEVYAGAMSIGGRNLVYEIVHDVTERREAEDALRATEARYRTLVEQLPVVTYRYGFDPADPSRTVSLYVGPQIEGLLGVTPEEWLSDPGLWARMVHPDDLRRVDEGGMASRASATPIVAEYRMIRRDGGVVWIHDSSAPLLGVDGSVIAWQGIYQDVTEKVLAEQALRASERRFRAMFDGAAVGIARIGLDGTILEANDALAELIGITRSQMEGATRGAFFWDPDAGVLPEEFVRMSGGMIDRYEVDRQYLRRNGKRIWCHVVVSLVRDEEDLPDFTIAMIEDITARKAAEDELARRAMHDALTGLPNRDLLADRMGIALARVERGGSGLAVMFLDLDGFKRVNDELGHDLGDRLLIEVTGRFQASLRPSDTLARYGGDEFVVLCQDVWTMPDAIAAAGRLAGCLDDPFELPGGAMASVGVSIGVTLALDGSRDGERLIREADTAMYRAKQRGRGGVAAAAPQAVDSLGASA